MPDQPSNELLGVIQKVGTTVTAVTAIVGAVVALNTALSTMTNDRVARFTAFRQAVASEETYWKSLYDDYLTVFTKDFADDQLRRDRKLFALLRLSDHPVPDFEEFSVPKRLKTEAGQRLFQMRASLKEALSDPEASGAQVAVASRAATAAADEAISVRGPDGAAASPEADRISLIKPEMRVSSGPSLQTQVLSVGQAKGWDVDVFWCPDGDPAKRYAEAQAAAFALVKSADKDGKLPGGALLGRVRLRALPLGMQTSDYLGRGRYLLVDAAETGQPVLGAVTGGLAAGGQPFGLRPTLGRTPWYLSAFVCPAAAAAPARAQGPAPPAATP